MLCSKPPAASTASKLTFALASAWAMAARVPARLGSTMTSSFLIGMGHLRIDGSLRIWAMMSNCLFYLAAVTLVGVVVTLVEFVLGNRSLHRLQETPPLNSDRPPTVSVIIAGRNEERKIEQA